MAANQKTVKVPDRVYDMITKQAERYGISRSTLVDIAIRHVASGAITIAPEVKVGNVGGDVAIAGKTLTQRVKKK